MRQAILSLIVSLCLALPAMAQDSLSAPEKLVRQTTQDVLETLEKHSDELKADPAAVYDYVAKLVLPHFDFQLMSRFVLGRHWNDASAKQRERFVAEFRKLLVRTYGTSLSEYSDQKVEFPPMQSDPERGRVTVPTKVMQKNGPSIPVDYRLHNKTESGEWKVFDVVIDGVSLVQNYRSSFASEIARSGLDGLIERLAKRNAKHGGGG